MRLDRNLNKQGKYILIKARELEKHTGSPAFGETNVVAAMRVLHDAGLLVTSELGSPDEFFVIKLRDQFAEQALISYAQGAYDYDKEYSKDVLEMSERSGLHSPYCKLPD